MSSVYILGNRVDSLTLAEAVDRVAGFIAAGTPHQVVTLNAEIAYRAYREARLQEVINRAALVTADGAGIVWAARKLGTPLPQRVTGIDLLEALAEAGSRQGWRFYLYGAAPGVAARAAKRLTVTYPGLKIAGSSHGYLAAADMPQLLAEIKAARPQVLLVGLGAPKQEYWIAEHLQELEIPVAMGVGGSFDVLAGVAKRAPLWLQRLNLEWLYRIITGKRFKRALALPRFMLAVLQEARDKRQNP